jgi:mono/diheme cytochrome c family protein
MKRELFALAIVLVLLIAFPASLFAYQEWRTNPPGIHVITLNGNAPGSGGWQPDSVRVNLGERVRLRLTANDVVHGFAIPALGVQVDEILPGHVQEVEFVASQVGRFPFACTRWCSVDHWRMRGVIQVVDPSNPGPAVIAPEAPPLYQRLGVDLDAMVPAQNIPVHTPSSARGAALNVSLPSYLEDISYLRQHSPGDLFAQLRGDAGFKSLNDSQLWDVIALAFERASGAEAIKRGQQLFARDCAACHGETGKGNGPAGINLPGLATMHPEMKRGPADFTNATQMLGASDVLLEGKMLRGGMGTGMPEWGSLYTEQDLWDTVSYLRSFIFDYTILRK